MNNFLTSRKLIWVFLVIGILAILTILVVSFSSRKQTASINQAQSPAAKIVTKNIDPSKLPDKFPVDLPQEEGATITTNDVKTTADGRFQATRSYITKKTLAENISIFKTYFQSHGWTVTATVDLTNFKSISATKGDINIQVSLNDNQVTKQKTVDIFVVQQVALK